MLPVELRFRSWVAASGYRWTKYDSLPGPRGEGHPLHTNGWVLTKNHDCVSSRQYKVVDFMEDKPTVFREFAAIPADDREAAKSFASRYGMLDADERLHYPATSLPNRSERCEDTYG